MYLQPDKLKNKNLPRFACLRRQARQNLFSPCLRRQACSSGRRGFARNKFNRAFTLIEALVALSILIVGIISGFILVTKALYDVTIIQDRLTASFLAQEGLELVRQIRDTNYFKKLNEGTGSWDDGLNNGDYIISANINTGTVTLISSSNPSYDPYLYYHPITDYQATMLYDHDSSGSKTSFQRVINIFHVNDNEIRVQSIVTWKSRNISFEIGKGGIVAEDHLFNWLKL